MIESEVRVFRISGRVMADGKKNPQEKQEKISLLRRATLEWNCWMWRLKKEKADFLPIVFQSLMSLLKIRLLIYALKAFWSWLLLQAPATKWIFICLLIHSHVDSSAHSFTHFFSHSFTHSFTYSMIHWHSFILSFLR